jgi:hypothetical protein
VFKCPRSITHAQRSAWESSSGLFQPSRPPERDGLQLGGERLTSFPAASVPQQRYQGCRIPVRGRSLDSSSASPIAADTAVSLVESNMRL